MQVQSCALESILSFECAQNFPTDQTDFAKKKHMHWVTMSKKHNLATMNGWNILLSFGHLFMLCGKV